MKNLKSLFKNPVYVLLGILILVVLYFNIAEVMRQLGEVAGRRVSKQ
ncbi:hypothetical protein [Zhouia amylolytica]|nr:hypothetical protein [Zhouia amylolytica]MCQ0111478.1 hypothetical protein [Zhouia amylolytica]